MTDIITITLNPAYDLHYIIEDFQPYKENFVGSSTIESGGKGVNISRALHINGTANTAFVILGEENSAPFEKSIKAQGMNFVPVHVPGKIRENITIHTKNAPETRISLDDFSVGEEILDILGTKIKKCIGKGTVVAFSGRIPRGLKAERVIGFLKWLKDAGALLAVDCGSFGIKELSELKPWLIKPNEQEILSLCKGGVKTIDDALRAAGELASVGIDNVIVSMGGQGAVYVGKDTALIAQVPKITPVSTIGAGDSTVAGFVSAFAEGLEMPECLRRAVSFGTAACLTEGTQPPLPTYVERIMRSVTVTPAR